MSLLVSFVLAVTVAQPMELKTRAEAVVTIARNAADPQVSKAAIAEAFRQIEDKELAPSLLRTYDTRTLEILFEALAVTSERLHRPELVQPLEDIFQECLSRGFVGNMIEAMYIRYIERRDWTKARILNERFPSKPRQLPNIDEPAITKEGVPAVYIVSRDGRTLSYTPIDLSGPIIVAVVSPGCHFSNDLVALIEADPKLVRLFRKHAVNIEPATYSLDAENLSRVNRDGHFTYTVLYRGSDWVGFDFSFTPQLYFVKDRTIVYKMDGKDRDDFKAKLAKGVAMLGL